MHSHTDHQTIGRVETLTLVLMSIGVRAHGILEPRDANLKFPSWKGRSDLCGPAILYGFAQAWTASRVPKRASRASIALA